MHQETLLALYHLLHALLDCKFELSSGMSCQDAGLTQSEWLVMQTANEARLTCWYKGISA
jgi:hypothetical protein